jgi:hypothetical protein
MWSKWDEIENVFKGDTLTLAIEEEGDSAFGKFGKWSWRRCKVFDG